ncbi:TIGR04149 family rSAM-modified RiPP [Pedobacter sp. Hv1]|uniref:TIGR04149 family rSAM-modified RiPP n=1 Tax=Pedobacter sp. Hv1 TaxID=1740090 RepID=UPI0006D8A1BB|nr:TIGR04149 family rSAM-modified RiPP [Pedobacter sp. Hv1]KQB98624.1 hypothetical protein AQF98_21530 [Pedobacter sp. Hv1]
MKKINFKNLSSDEVLSKNELKKIIGGNGSGCQVWVCYCPGVGFWDAFTCSSVEVDAMYIVLEDNCSSGGGFCTTY